MKWPQKNPPAHKAVPSGFFKLSPFKSLSTLLLLILAIAIIATSLGIYQVHRRILKESLLKQAEQRAHNSHDFILNRLHKNMHELLNQNRNLVARYDVHMELLRLLEHPENQIEQTKLERLFEREAHDFEPANISLFDKQGQLRFSHGQKADFDPTDINISTALKGYESMGLAQEGNLWVIRTAVPIKQGTKNRGVLTLSLGLNLILDSLADELKINLALANASGVQVHSTSALLLASIDLADVHQALENDGMKTRIDLQLERLSHYMSIKIKDKAFVLISEVSLSPVLLILHQKKHQALQLTLLLLLVLLPTSALIIHLLQRPLVLLRKRAHQIVLNLVGSSQHEVRGHEISQMVSAFDEMESALNEHEAARQKAEALLQQEHATLEVRVKDRTLELVKANELLQLEIRERTRSQQKAEGLQSFLASLIDSMPSALIGVDHKNRINQWNSEARKSFGLSFEQVRGLDLYETLPQIYQIHERIQQTIEKDIQNTIRRLPWSGGENALIVDIGIYPLAGLHLGGAVIRIDDVTDRSRIDELMIQTEKMVSVGGLAAGMAHEINNPLASIIQGAQVISQRLSPELAKNRECAASLGIELEQITSYLDQRQVRKMLTSIHDSGQRASEIVSNMLSFTRRTDSVKSAQNIAQILDRSVDLATKDYDLKKQYDFYRIKIERNYASDVPEVFCVSSQLQQVFFNLLQNAAQALASNGNQHEPSQIVLEINKKGEMLQVEISDNGPGIEIETQKRIFEPFFTTKAVGQGTGLGLSVSYFIITENHNGRLELESAPGKGTKFKVLLPLEIASDTELRQGPSEIAT